MNVGSRKYLLAGAVALATFVAVEVIDLALVKLHLRAEVTYLDNLLLASLAAIFIYLLENFHERELLRLRELAVIVDEMNHHIRNALQVIAAVSAASASPEAEGQIHESVDRIERVLREVLGDRTSRMGVRPEPELKAGKRLAG